MNFNNPRTLRLRSQIIKSIRQFFWDRDYIEVDTPILVPSPGLESNLMALETIVHSYSGSMGTKFFMHTSPEFAMKKILSQGWPRIFQIAKVFRDEENTSVHQTEFLMLEWYRTNAQYEEFMHEVEDLFQYVCQRCEQTFVLPYKNRQMNLAPPWKKISVNQAFMESCGINLLELQGTTDLARAASNLGLKVSDTESWEDIFHFIYVDRVEPWLNQFDSLFLYDYPSQLRILSRLSDSNPRIAQRFEVYLGGMELANAFAELVEPGELEKVLEIAYDKRHKLGLPEFPIDQDLIKAAQIGIPQCCGIALGVDRLVMLLSGESDIKKVQFVSE